MLGPCRSTPSGRRRPRRHATPASPSPRSARAESRSMALPAGQAAAPGRARPSTGAGAAATIIVYEARPIDAAGRDRGSAALRRRRPFAARRPRLAELASHRSSIADRRHQPGRGRGLRAGLAVRPCRARSRPTRRCWPSPPACAKDRRHEQRGSTTRAAVAGDPRLGRCCCSLPERRWPSGASAAGTMAARFLGVAPRPSPPVAVRAVPQPARPLPAGEADAAMAPRLAALESRLRLVENASRRTAGSVGRADALLVAFASRRAIDRGVPLGYLEGLLADRFGGQYPRAVAAIVTASRNPVTLEELTEEYQQLSPLLRRGAPTRACGRGSSASWGRWCRCARRPRRRAGRRRATTGHWPTCRTAMSTPPWPKPCACPAPSAHRTGSPRRGAMCLPTARSTRSKAAALFAGGR